MRGYRGKYKAARFIFCLASLFSAVVYYKAELSGSDCCSTLSASYPVLFSPGKQDDACSQDTGYGTCTGKESKTLDGIVQIVESGIT